jgi:HPt (histidine-containing phosphotransfer) domain-containing protein
MMQAMNAREPVSALLDPKCIEEIRYVERAVGRNDVLSGFIATLERNLASFAAAFAEALARGDDKGAARTAHTLKGACHQLGMQALGNLFADIERSARSGHYAEAKRSFEAGAGLIEESLQALKQA